ncbi:MAG: DNA replication/repair protein RecF [Bacteroidales bacterium]
MFLQRLQLNQFKNCLNADLVFSPKINCFVGNNGAGKTNILDAVYYLSFCKSYFNPTDQQNIMHEKEFFGIHGTYFRNGNEPDQVSCVQKKNVKKSFRFNKKEYERLADHIGKFPLVMISPYDRDLINEGSDMRRKFIDGVISQFDPIYLDELITYNKALLQRNTLLKQFAENRYFDQDLLTIWDTQLVRSGGIIHEKRKSILVSFLPLFNHYYRIVSNQGETVSIQYDSDLHDKDMHDLLINCQTADRQARYTTKGIHKDELVFLIDGFQLKRFGSQGQQKSFVIAIKLAQFEYTRQLMNYKPILLFDDIFDKLDDQRVEQLINLVGEDSFGQVFITDTQLHRIELLFQHTSIHHKIFRVHSGVVDENVYSVS